MTNTAAQHHSNPGADGGNAFRPAVLILVGTPGAGKSTFAAALQAACPGRWQRINQVPPYTPIHKISSMCCQGKARVRPVTVCILKPTEGHTDPVQDTVAGGGRRGTRPQCVAAARAAVLAGQGAIIDRCNWNIPQRMDFTALAKEMGCQVQALLRDLRHNEILHLPSLKFSTFVSQDTL